MIRLFEPYIAKDAHEAIKFTLDLGWISQGKATESFAQEIKQLGYPAPVLVNSGTAALHLACEVFVRAHGHIAQPEIIVPSQTFIASALAVRHAGATPVFVDVKKDGTINWEATRHAITPNTVAVMAVDWAGHQSSIPHDLPVGVIVDAAHSFGAPLDPMAMMTCFSFQAIKHVTTGDGGAVVVEDEDIRRDLTNWSWFGIDKKAKVSGTGERLYALKRWNVGYKYHMNDIAATLGLANIKTLDRRLAHIRKMYDLYAFHLPVLQKETPHAPWLCEIEVHDVIEARALLFDRGIETAMVHRGIDQHPVWSTGKELPMQRWRDRHALAVPLHWKLTQTQALEIIKVVQEVL